MIDILVAVAFVAAILIPLYLFFFGHHVGKQECTINQAQEEIK